MDASNARCVMIQIKSQRKANSILGVAFCEDGEFDMKLSSVLHEFAQQMAFSEKDTPWNYRSELD